MYRVRYWRPTFDVSSVMHRAAQLTRISPTEPSQESDAHAHEMSDQHVCGSEISMFEQGQAIAQLGNVHVRSLRDSQHGESRGPGSSLGAPPVDNATCGAGYALHGRVYPRATENIIMSTGRLSSAMLRSICGKAHRHLAGTKGTESDIRASVQSERN